MYLAAIGCHRGEEFIASSFMYMDKIVCGSVLLVTEELGFVP
jgi:hypothetical protein